MKTKSNLRIVVVRIVTIYAALCSVLPKIKACTDEPCTQWAGTMRFTVTGSTLRIETGWLHCDGSFQVFNPVEATFPDSWLAQYRPVSGRPILQLTLYNLGKSSCLRHWKRSDAVYNLAGVDYVLVCIDTVCDPNAEAPTITTQPTNQTVLAGRSVTFSVVATGSPAPNFQWRRNGSNLGGKTSSVLTLNQVQLSAVGEYTAVVSNSGGSVTSHVARLTVIETNQPTVKIVSPVTGARLTNSTVIIQGTASDNLGVASVEYRLQSATGINSYRPAVGTTNWTATIADVAPGTNTVRVRATDITGNIGNEVTCSFIYVSLSAVALTTNGHGAVTGLTNQQRLEIGRPFTLKAVPAVGQLFSNWVLTTGIGLPDIRTTPTLSFIMSSNLTITANFIANPFIAAAGAFNGLFYPSDPEAIQFTNSGLFNLVLTSRGSYTAKLPLGGRKMSVTGQFDLSGNAQNIVTAGGHEVTLRWAVDLAATDRITGDISDGSWTANIQGDRAVFNASTHPCPNAGKYTLAILGWSGATGAPAGHSFVTMTVDPGGVAKLLASLADKTKGTQAVPISKEGLVPLYIPQVKGSLISWVAFTNGTTEDLKGNLTWSKLENPSAPLYPAGFNEQTTLVGSRYTVPVTTNRILSLTIGQAIFADGNLPRGYTNTFLLGPSSKFTNLGPDTMTATFTASSALFKGTFSPAGGFKPLTFNGVVLQKGTNGFGFVIGTNQSSSVTVEVAP